MKREAKIIKMLFSLLTLFAFVAPICLAKTNDLLLTTWCGPPFSNSEKTGYLDLILQEASERMNLKINIERRPAERSLKDANQGKTDGDFLRVVQIGALYPNLLMVPESLYRMEFVAFATKDDVKIDNSWKSLEPYSVGIVRGWKILEKNVIFHKSRRSLSKQEHLFLMLDRGRLDVAVYSKHFGFEVISRLGLKGIKALDPPLVVKQMYLFLHKKHEAIIPKLSNIFKSMKEEGRFEKIKEKTLLRNQ